VSKELSGKKVLFMTANEGVEQVELTTPWEAVKQAGAEAVLAAPEAGEVQAFNHLDKADTFRATVATSSLRVEDYDGLVLPGGVANPDQLRGDQAAVNFIRAFVEAGRPVAVICHGPWTLVEAGVVRDRTVTSWPSLRTDITNAGGHWVDEEVFVCESSATPNTLISSRQPDDLAAFCAQIVTVFARPIKQRRAA
jgi:protease I